jgi:DNA-binding transcriptional LysR family regulator
VLHHCNALAVPWGDVHLFLAVVRHGSVRGAARALRLDPSTVSRRVASLEHAVGARLFERTKGRLTVTPSGQLMVQSGERVDGEIEELERRIVGHDRRLGGVVRVTFPGSFASMVHAAIPSLTRRHPAIEVELLTLDALIDIDGRQADVAIRVANEPPEHLVGRRVAALAGALYASRAYLEHHDEPLASPEHTWVDWDRRLAAKPAIAWVDEQFAPRRVVARGLSTADVFAAALAGTGIAPLPCLVGDAEPKLVRLLDAPETVWSSVWLLTHGSLRPAARVRAVMRQLSDVLGDAKALIEGRSPYRTARPAIHGEPDQPDSQSLIRRHRA